AVLADPEALLGDPQIVQALLHAQATAGDPRRKVVDLRGALLDRLESRLGRLEETHRSVVAAAYENLAGVQSLHRAALAVLAPDSFEGLMQALAGEIPGVLAVDSLRLGLETEARDGAAAPLAALEPGFVALVMADGAGAPEDGPARQVILRPLSPLTAPLYGADAARVTSEALVRLEFGEGLRPGLLAFGSVDPMRFTPDQGSELLEFFGGVLARVVRRWMTG
ncbi:MAG: DUF484 family protein, partial [Pseudomonadota bacterium]